MSHNVFKGTPARVLVLGLAILLACSATLPAQYLVHEENLQSKYITAMGFFRHSDTLFSSGMDNTLKAYSIKSRKSTPLAGQWEKHAIRQISPSSSNAIALRSNYSLFSLEFSTGIGFLSTGTREECPALQFIPLTNSILYADGYKVYSWNTSTQGLTEVYADESRRQIKNLQVFNKTPAMLLVYKDESIDIIHYQGRKRLGSLPARYGSISAVGLSTDDHYLAIGNTMGKVVIRDLDLEKDVWQESLHTHQVSELQFAPQGAFLLSRSFDQKVKITAVPEGRNIFTVQLEGAIYPLLAMSRDGKYFAVNKNNLTVQIFKLKAILSDYLYQQALAWFKENALEKAEKAAALAIRNQASGELYSLRGKVNLALDRKEAALADLSEAIKAGTDLTACRILRAGILQEQKLYREALADLDLVLALSKNDTLALTMKSQVLTDLGDYPKARQVMDALLPLLKNPDILLAQRVKTLMALRQYTEALPDLEKLISLKASDALYMQRGQCNYFLGNYEQATEDFFTRCKAMEHSPTLTRFKAYSAFCVENYGQAIGLFQQMLKEKKDEPEIINALAFSFLATNNTDAFQSLANQCLLANINKNNILFLRAINNILRKEEAFVYEDLKTIYAAEAGFRFKLGDSLQLNTKRAYQSIMNDFFTCIADRVQYEKPDFSPMSVTEYQTAYNARAIQSQHAVSAIVEDCHKRFLVNSKEAVKASIKPITLSIGLSKQYNPATGRYHFQLGNEAYYISKLDESRGMLLEQEWRKVVIMGYQQLTENMMAWRYFKLRALLPYSYDTLDVYQENQETLADNARKSPLNAERGGQDKLGEDKIKSLKTMPLYKKNYNNYLLVIAVDNYKHWPRLKTAVHDAKTFAQVLLEKYNFDSAHMISLFNEEVTRASLFNTLNQLSSRVKKDDRLVIYYAGHGDNLQSFNDGYWVPHDVKPGEQYQCFSYSELRKIISNMNTLHTVLINDACFSGLMSGQRSSGEEIANRLETLPSRFVIASGMHDEQVDDQFKDTNHSPFAYYLITFLRANEKPALSIYSLATHIQEMVLEQTNSKQHPEFSNLRDFPDTRGLFYFHLKE